MDIVKTVELPLKVSLMWGGGAYKYIYMFMMIENALLHELNMNTESQSDCVQSRHIYPSFVLVQPRKTCPYISERLLMGRKE